MASVTRIGSLNKQKKTIYFPYVTENLYVYWCQTRFPYHVMFVSSYSKMTGVTGEAGTAQPSGAPEFTPGF